MTTPEPEPEIAANLAADIRALTTIERPSASPGEEAAAQWVASRFQEEGLNTEIETFRYNPDYWSVWGAHSLLSATAAWTALMSRRWALPAAATAALATVSLFGEFTFTHQLLRRALPTRRSYNVLARLPNPSASRLLSRLKCSHTEQMGRSSHSLVRPRRAQDGSRTTRRGW